MYFNNYKLNLQKKKIVIITIIKGFINFKIYIYIYTYNIRHSQYVYILTLMLF